MSIATRHRELAQRERAEWAALVKIADRLAGQFPELSVEEIDRVIHGRYMSFEGSRIRDFVPVLVERRARRDLAAR